MSIFVGIMAMLLVLCVFLPLLLWWLDLLLGGETPKEEEEVGTHRRRALQYLYGEARKSEGEEEEGEEE